MRIAIKMLDVQGTILMSALNKVSASSYFLLLKKLPSYTLAGFDLTTHSYSRLDETMPPGQNAAINTINNHVFPSENYNYNYNNRK
jgi:hypothetical protein